MGKDKEEGSAQDTQPLDQRAAEGTYEPAKEGELPTMKILPRKKDEKVAVGAEKADVPVNVRSDLKFRVGKNWVELKKGRQKVTKQVYDILLAANEVIPG